MAAHYIITVPATGQSAHLRTKQELEAYIETHRPLDLNITQYEDGFCTCQGDPVKIQRVWTERTRLDQAGGLFS